MKYVWVESDSQTQSDTTTASYAAVPAVEQDSQPTSSGQSSEAGQSVVLIALLLT